MTWQPIETAPKDETAVILYFANRVWKALDDSICPPDPVRDLAERTEIGFFRDGEWCETGTAHDYFEPWNEPNDQPTHWMPLPQPPTAQGGTDGA